MTEEKSDSSLSALLKIIKRVGIQHKEKIYVVSIAGMALLSLTPGVAVATVLGSIGVNLLSSIIDKVALGGEVSDLEIAELVLRITEDDLKNLLPKEEYWVGVGRLIRRFDIIGVAIKEGELAIAEQLSMQYSQHHELLGEIRSYSFGMLKILHEMSNKLSDMAKSSEISALDNKFTLLITLFSQILYPNNATTSPILLDSSMQTPIYPNFTGMGDMTNYLPYLRNPLRGRHADVQILLDYLAKGGVTQLTGVGGLGKSRISAEIALAYKNGAVWHRCNAISKREDVEKSLRQHLVLLPDAPTDLILTKIAERQSLLVIDNAEEVTPANRIGYMGLFNQLADYGVPILLTAREQWQSTPSLTFLSEKHPLKSFTDADLDIATQMTHDFYAKFGKTFTDDEAKQLAKSGRFHPKLIEFAVGLVAESGHSYDTIIERLDDLTHDEIQEVLDEMITKTLEQMRDVAKYGKKAYDLIHNLKWLQATFPMAVIDALKPANITTHDLLDALVTLKKYQFLRDADVKERYSLPELVRETLKPPTDHPELFNIYADFYTQLSISSDGIIERDDFLNIKFIADRKNLSIQSEDINDLECLDGRPILVNNSQYGEMGLRATRELIRNQPDNLDLIQDEVRYLSGLADYWYKSDNPNKALDNYKDLLNIYGNNKNQMCENLTRNNIQKCLDRLNDKQLILSYYLDSREKIKVSGDKEAEFEIITKIANTYDSISDFAKALEYYKQALSIILAIGDTRRQALILNNLGSVYSALEQKDKALAYYEQALSIMRVEGDRSGEAITLNNISAVYSVLGEMQMALEYYEQALMLTLAIGDKSGEASMLNNIGTIYHAIGKTNEALAYYEQSLPITREVGNRSGEASTLNNIGSMYQAIGKMNEALIYYEQALLITREVGNRSGEASTLNNIGIVYQAIGKMNEALAYYEESLPIMREVGNRSGEATILTNIGAVYKVLGKISEAMMYYEQALPMHREVKNKRMEAITLNNIGTVYKSWGKISEAMMYYEQALPMHREVENKQMEATTLNNIGGIYKIMRKMSEALDNYEQALAVFIAIDAQLYVVPQQFNIAILLDEMGQLDEAINRLEIAIKIMHDNNWSHAGGGELQLAQIEQMLMVYKRKHGDTDVLPQ